MCDGAIVLGLTNSLFTHGGISTFDSSEGGGGGHVVLQVGRRVKAVAGCSQC